jgi:DNA-binding CsgD family transcriptional regulator
VRQHRDWIDKATARFWQVKSPTEQLHLAALRVSALIGLGEQDGWSAAAEIPRVGSSPAEQRMILLSMADVGRLAIKWGRYAEAATRLRTATERIQAAGYQRKLSITRAGCAYLAWYTGQWADLRQTVAELAEAETTEEPGVRLEAREIQGLLELATGARKAAEQRLTATLAAHARQAPLGHQAATTAGGLGRLRLADGGAAAALQVTGPVVARIVAKGLWLWATDLIWVHLEALAAAGELSQAEELAERFTSWLPGGDAPAPAAAGVLCQAIVTQARGDLDEAADLYARAAKAWAGLPRPYDELLALERQGRCLLAADQPDRGLAVLAETRLRLHELGARWDADRLARTLRQHGVDTSRSGRGSGRDGDQLSPREREVMALVARGMTNREAARVMFLAEKTIEYYLGNAMRKLGVSTRTAAAMAAASAGLLAPASEAPVRTRADEEL